MPQQNASSSARQEPQSQSMNSSFEDDEFRVNEENKKNEIVYLVKDGIDFLVSHRTEEAFNAFSNERRFVKGDITLFVIDIDGNVYVSEQNLNKVWDNVKNYKNNQGISIYDLIIKKALTGGGWLDYERQYEFKSTYVETVEKDGVTYVIGAGWYSSAKYLEVENLVQSAVVQFNKIGSTQAFAQFNNPVGTFVKGDLYIFAYDLNGACVADGENNKRIGKNLINLKDANAQYPVKKIIEAAQKGTGWVSYQWNNVPKISFVVLVGQGAQQFVIGCGYYPRTDRKTAVEFVKTAVKYFDAWGREKAAETFSGESRKRAATYSDTDQFIQGNLTIFMYDFNGKVLAQGDNLQTIIETQKIDTSRMINQVIQFAKTGGGWIEFEWKNDLMLAYIEKVTDPQGEYLIGTGFFPDTQREKVEKLVRSASMYLQDAQHTLQGSMKVFQDRESGFILGTFDVFVFNMQGDCLVFGDDSQVIWRNFANFKDDEGKKVFRLLLHQANLGGGWVVYKSRNGTKLAYVEKVVKNGISYVIGSGFYK